MRLCIFAHFDKKNKIGDYVIFYLKQLREISDYLIFVSSATLSEDELNKIKNFVDKTITRENIGYDFMSWKVGVESVDNIDSFDELVICNDSVYGPLFPFAEAFKRMRNSDCDFWGMTDSHDIAYHLQSYFLVFRKNVLASETFKYFWKKVAPLENKQDVIHQYEVGLTQTLVRRGFKPHAYIYFEPSLLNLFKINISLPEFIAEKYKKYSLPKFFIKGMKAGLSLIINHRRFLRRLNPTHFYWRDCVKKGMPFIKRDLLKNNPANVDIKNFTLYLSNLTNYPVDLIKKDLEENQSNLVQ